MTVNLIIDEIDVLINVAKNLPTQGKLMRN